MCVCVVCGYWFFTRIEVRTSKIRRVQIVILEFQAHMRTIVRCTLIHIPIGVHGAGSTGRNVADVVDGLRGGEP